MAKKKGNGDPKVEKGDVKEKKPVSERDAGGGGGGGGGGKKEDGGGGGGGGGKKEDGGGGGGGGGKKEDGGGGGGGGGKKEEGPITVVLKVDMHCEGCTKRIRQSVKGFKGVEGVATDVGSGKLTVVGTVDPWKLRDRVALKTHKKVDLVSPINPPKKDANPPAAAAGRKDPKKPDDKKPKEPAVTTVVLKIRLHCQGCILRIRRTILKIKGAMNVTFDVEKDLVTVKGTMDAKRLPEVLKEKLKKGVEVVAPKKEDGGGEKKKGGDGEKKEKGGDGEKKEKGGGKKEGGKDEAEGGGKAAAAEVSKMDYYGGYGYRMEMVHAPQLFSDENPNGCTIM